MTDKLKIILILITTFIHSTKWQITTLYRPSFGSKVLQASFHWPIIIPKITPFRRRFLRQNRKSAFTAIFNVIPWYLVKFFSLAIIAGHASAISREPFSLISTWLVCARKEFLVIQSHRERRTLPIPISEIFWATQSYLRIIVTIVLFTSKKLAQIALVSWNPSTDR